MNFLKKVFKRFFQSVNEKRRLIKMEIEQKVTVFKTPKIGILKGFELFETYLLAIFWNEIPTILTLSTLEEGEWGRCVFRFRGP